MAAADLLNPGSGMSCTVILLALLTLILMIANSCRFAFLSKVRRTLVILFYTFAFANAAIIATSNILREYATYFTDG